MNQDSSEFGPERLAVLEQARPIHSHDHPPVRNVNVTVGEHLTAGQRIADAVAARMGSWVFIIIQSVLLVVWVTLNVVAFVQHWDPYPFILLNLALSFQAAYSAPIIMMSQNRQSMKDRLAAEHDYQINLKAEEEIKAILSHLEYQDDLILHLLHRLDQAGVADPAAQPAATSPG